LDVLRSVIVLLWRKLALGEPMRVQNVVAVSLAHSGGPVGAFLEPNSRGSNSRQQQEAAEELPLLPRSTFVPLPRPCGAQD